MRKWSLPCVLIFFVCNCSSPTYPKLRVPTDIKILERHLSQIVSDSAYRNYQNLEELNRVAAYVKEQIEQFGYACEYQEFVVKANDYRNVVCILDLGFDERMVAGAHYDVCGDQPGADDNGSGVAGLIELARLLAEHQSQLKYNIELVAYSLEEPPFFATEHMGSYVHAKGLADADIDIIGMISLEMIGYFSDKEIQDYPKVVGWFYPKKGNFIAAVSNWGSRWMTKAFEDTMVATSTLPVETLSAPSFITGVDFSDHRNYWEFGYDAMMITDTAFFRNKNYHESTDTIETLDMEKIAQVVDGVAAMMLSGALSD